LAQAHGPGVAGQASPAFLRSALCRDGGGGRFLDRPLSRRKLPPPRTRQLRPRPGAPKVFATRMVAAARPPRAPTAHSTTTTAHVRGGSRNHARGAHSPGGTVARTLRSLPQLLTARPYPRTRL